MRAAQAGVVAGVVVKLERLLGGAERGGVPVASVQCLGAPELGVGSVSR